MNFLFYAPQMAAYGGMERHICTLAAAAAHKGHKVRFLTTSNSLGTELRSLMANPLIDLRELPSARMQASSARKALWLAKSVLSARMIAWDSIYTNGQSGLASWVWRAARRDTQIIHHHHTASDSEEQASWSPMFRRMLETAPVLAGCSEATCANIAAAVKRRTPPRFLPYLTRCVMEAEQIDERRPGEHIHLGFLGRLVKEKGLDTIMALSREPGLDDLRWHIHGEGDTYPEATFTSYPNIHYHGAYRDASRHREILSGLDAVVLLSTHNEGMPLSLIEAMSAGLPWVATDKGGTRELARSPADCLVIPPGEDLQLTASRIRHFADSLRSGMISRRRQRATYDAFLSPSIVSAAWLALLETRPTSA